MFLSGDENSDDDGEEVQETAAVTQSNVERRNCCPSWIISRVESFVGSILCFNFFIIFNVICIIQTVPALYYYISFFQPGFFLKNSSGMPTVWGATVGSICSVIVTTALGPLPPNLIFRPFCIAVIIWEYMIFVFLLVAAVGLGIQHDWSGVVWSVLGSLSGLLSGVFLTWLGSNIRILKFRQNQANFHAPSSSIDIPLPQEESGLELTGVGSQAVGLDQEMAAVTSTSDSNPSTPSPQPSRTVLFYVVQALLWIVLTVFYVIPIGFGINEAITAHEASRFGPPGSLHDVPLSSSDSQTIPMHLYCQGEKSTSVVVFEAEFADSGYSLLEAQSQLVDLGWRVCLYDRAGYGWSRMSPLGSNGPVAVADRLFSLLTLSEEIADGQRLILVGYGAGGEMTQVFAHLYPAVVSGLVLVDAYSSKYKLRGMPGKDVKRAVDRDCGSIQIGRAMDSIGLLRPVASSDFSFRQRRPLNAGFVPSDAKARYTSTFNNGRYWASYYSDWCVEPGQANRFTDYLTMNSNNSEVSDVFGSLSWPSLPSSARLLLLSAERTITEGPDHQLFYQQAQLYNSTLAPGRSRWVVCAGCGHSFPVDSAVTASWLAGQVDSFLSHL